MARTIALIGALDTKATELAFVRDAIVASGNDVHVVDTGVIADPPFAADTSATEVAVTGGVPLDRLRADADRGRAIEVMARGATGVIRRLYEAGTIHGILGLGGSAGTTIGTAAMRGLPVGFPKVMVSTLAAGDTRPYMGSSDITMMSSVVDIAGINTISAPILSNAAAAITGMVQAPPPTIPTRPLLAATMFGNTTPLVDRCRDTLDEAGYETLVFHATGTGGRTMEDLVDKGLVVGALDVSPTELADELVGGVLSAGPTRMEAASRAGIPQVVVPGCLDMVNFWARDTVPDRFADRRLHMWNPTVTLMRTTPEESAELGKILAAKTNPSTGPVVFFLPRRGLSMLDIPGGEFWWPEADQALFDAIVRHARPDHPVVEMDVNINDPELADAVTDRMLALLA